MVAGVGQHVARRVRGLLDGVAPVLHGDQAVAVEGDRPPGDVARESIENLGSSGKAWLLPGITITAILLGAALGDASKRISLRIGVVGPVSHDVLPDC